jgi:hypothetical protein
MCPALLRTRRKCLDPVHRTGEVTEVNPDDGEHESVCSPGVTIRSPNMCNQYSSAERGNGGRTQPGTACARYRAAARYPGARMGGVGCTLLAVKFYKRAGHGRLELDFDGTAPTKQTAVAVSSPSRQPRGGLRICVRRLLGRPEVADRVSGTMLPNPLGPMPAPPLSIVSPRS